MIFRFFFFFSFCFPFLFFFSNTRTWLPRTLRDKKGLFGTSPHLPYLTLPFAYLHNLRYVNLSNIRYLFTYQTSSQPPNLLYLPLPIGIPGSLSFHYYLVWSVPSIKSVSSSSHRTYRPHLSVKSYHLPHRKKNFQFFPSYLVPMVIHSSTPKAKFLNSNSRTRNQSN